MRRLANKNVAKFSLVLVSLASCALAACGDNTPASLVGPDGGMGGSLGGKGGGSGGGAGGGAAGKGGAGGKGGGAAGAGASAGAGGGSTGTGGGAGEGGDTGGAGGSVGGSSGTGGSVGGSSGTGGSVGGSNGGGGSVGIGGLGGSIGGAGGGGAGGTLAAPVVTFTSPTATSKLCGVGNTTTGCLADGSGTTAAWQGSITVHATAGGAPITTGNLNLSINGGAFTTAPLNVSGDATFASVTVPEGPSVSIVAKTDNIIGRGVGTTTINLFVDTIPPVAPTSVAAVIVDRRATSFTVTWNAPADNGGGYDIHVKKPSTSPTNPCGTEVKALTFAGTPKAAGMAETIPATGLYIENTYCFTVAAKDAVGNIGAVGSVSGIAAHFNQTVINGPQAIPANYAGFGYYLDGSGNFVGDTNTDLLVSDGWGFNAYLYAGGAAFTGAGPAVTFQSTVQYFGSSIANLGDVDGDTLDDIGISSAYDSPAKLFIFKGRAVWPATLSDTQADYVITTDSTFDSSALGFPIIKLGDINGDLVGDFALGASAYNNNAGALLVILGKAPFGSGALPGLVGSGRAILLTSPTYPSGNFGVSATVLGASNGTLVVGAITASTNKGQLTAYKWVTGTGLMAVGSPYLGGTGELLGSSLTVLGGGAGLISGDTTGAGSGFALSFLTGTAAMPFGGTTTRFVDSAAPTAFGTLALGGGFSGSNASISYVGDTKPDLIFGAAREGGNAASVYFVDGNDATTATSPVDVTMVARASVKLPADWMQVAFYNSPIKDVNGDGHGDVAIGEADDGTFSVPYRGRVLVLW